MGKTIENILLQRGHDLAGIITTKSNASDLSRLLASSDIAIEFSSPEAAPKNISSCLEAKVPVVCGTTGWMEHWQSVVNDVGNRQGALLYSSNFSVGVQLFFALNRSLARLMSSRSEYACELTEIHHTQKLDKPSGTAITLANDVIQIHPNYQKWKLDHPDGQSLPIHSIREGEVIGTHHIRYHSNIDEIFIEHKAFSREGFASGAVLAAEWLLGRHGVFSMQDVLEIRS